MKAASKTQPRRAGQSQNWRKWLLRVLGLAVLLVAFCGFLLWGKWPGPIDPLREGAAPRVLYEVPENTTASALVADLYSKKLIAFPRVLKVVLRVTGWEKRIRTGFYYLPPRNSVMEIASKLTFGEMATRAMTIPEGKASWEIYGILKKYFPLDSLQFETLVNSEEFARSLGLEAPGLEGYLYPDTYVVPWKLKEQDVLRLLVSRFQEVVADLPLEESDLVKKHGLHGLVTLASIVEKEAALNREQKTIAGVFSNRLRKGWSLGADPTVRFAVRKMTSPLRKADLSSHSLYNTRRFTGLPPGPICSPGESALRAALNPEKTRMMFFVAKDDGSHGHYFSETYAEHNAFIVIAAGNRARLREESRLRADSLAEATEAEAAAEALAADKTGLEEPPVAPAANTPVQAKDPKIRETKPVLKKISEVP